MANLLAASLRLRILYAKSFAASLQHRISRAKFIESYLQYAILRTKLPFAGVKWRFCIKNHSLQAKNSDFVGK
ncbi:hypothetical protein, partial [Porphyromonas gingivalis]|uniref:hypothetical protein n=1 Tax=Porphyromonas gingivalis TaxID=837 RepID=UPI001E605FFD